MRRRARVFGDCFEARGFPFVGIDAGMLATSSRSYSLREQRGYHEEYYHWVQSSNAVFAEDAEMLTGFPSRRIPFR